MKIKLIVDNTQFLPITYLIMLLVIFILPFFSFPEYSIIKNTTSHLGAQTTPNSWVMNLVFVFLGMAVIVDGWRSLGAFWFHKIVVLIFGISLIATAFFQHAPIIKEIPYNVQEDHLHSIFAKLTGWSFTTFAIATSFIIKGRFQKILAILIAILATLLSIVMFEVDLYMGVWQRLIFISSFGWLMFAFNRISKKIH